MSKPPKSFVKRVVHHLQTGFQSEGMKKRTPTLFTRDTNPNVFGVVTLGINLYDDSSVKIDPSVGVRHNGVEDLLVKLTGDNFGKYLPATIGCALGYLTPQNTFLIFDAFRPDEDPVPGVQHIVKTMKQYGFGWMDDNQTLDAMLQSMIDGKCAVRQQSRLRIPVIQYLKGDFAAARASVEKGLAELGESSGPVSDQFRRFAAGLIDKLEKISP
jgi:hypothetical protein